MYGNLLVIWFSHQETVENSVTQDLIEILDIVIWPALIVFALWGLTTKSGSAVAEKIFSRTRRVSLFGVELELGEEEGRRIKATLEEEFEDFRKDVKAEFDRQANGFDVSRLCAEVCEQVIEPLLKKRRGEYRCTVYVPDIVFKDALYRLLDYYPGGKGRGSTYSERFGIIGRTWRLHESQYEKTVPGDRKTLITSWGMNREEAAGQEAKSFVTFLLAEKGETPSVGLLYIEAEEKAFRKDPIPVLSRDPRIMELTTAVGLVMKEMRKRGPMLQLFNH